MDGRLYRALVFLFMLPGLAQADSVNAEWVSTTRSLTMGNVGIASAEDPTTAAFYNPAALARGKKAVFEPFNPQFDIGTGLFSTSRQITDWSKHGSHGSSLDLVKAKPGSVSSGGFSIYPNVTAQNFSFGVLGSVKRWSHYKKGDLSWNFYSRWLVVPSLGISMAFGGGRMRLGAAVRAIQITETKGVVPDTGSSIALNESTGEGLGIGLDAGMLITLPWSALPSIGFVARNVGDTSFPSRGVLKIGGGSKVTHEKIKMTYDAGISISPKLGQRDVLTFAVDMRDVLNKTGAARQRHFNVGTELNISKRLFLRAGYSQAYWTAGFGLASKLGALDLGTYAEELDPVGEKSTEDRKISIRFSRRF